MEPPPPSPSAPEVPPPAAHPQPAPAQPPKPGNLAPSARTLPPKPKPQSPFVYLGIPQFVLDWRPSRPGPKMSAFIAVTTILGGAYAYDRRECSRLQQEYIDQVKFMSEGKLDATELARVVKVYGARVPEDGDEQRSTLWFKRYMRPILNASGTDYVYKIGSTPGGLGRLLLSEIRGRRIQQAALSRFSSPSSALSPSDPQNAFNPDLSDVLDQKARMERDAELDGGIVVLGRNALKEYLWALKKGYGEAIDLREEARLEGLGLGANERRKDGRWEREEELLVRELQAEDERVPGGGPFGEREEPVGLASLAGDDEVGDIISKVNQPVSSIGFAGVPYSKGLAPNKKAAAPSPPPALAAADEPLILPAETEIPAQPPLLLVPFTHTFGIKSWLPKLLHFWNHRTEVRYGGEMALQLLAGTPRPLDPPTIRTSGGAVQGTVDLDEVERIRKGEEPDVQMTPGVPTGSPDLDFMASSDEFPSHFRRTYLKLPSNHAYARKTYYADELPPKLKVARELASGEREPTSSEQKFPPKMESELRKERLEKETRWRRELEGWGVQRSGSGVGWGEGWEAAFKVYGEVGQEGREELRRARLGWEEDKSRKEEEVRARVGDL